MCLPMSELSTLAFKPFMYTLNTTHNRPEPETIMGGGYDFGCTNRSTCKMMINSILVRMKAALKSIAFTMGISVKMGMIVEYKPEDSDKTFQVYISKI